MNAIFTFFLLGEVVIVIYFGPDGLDLSVKFASRNKRVECGLKLHRSATALIEYFNLRIEVCATCW